MIDGEPHFVARDICDRLGYLDAINAIKLHAKGVVKYHPLQTAGGVQSVRVINEADVLRLIVASKLPAAEEFERIVFEEILPTIRRTGSYGAAGGDLDLDDPSLLHGLILKHTAQNIQLRHQVSVMAPQVATLHRIAKQDGEFCLRDCAKTLSMSPKAFNSWLISIRWLYRDGADDLRPYQDRIESGHMKLRRSETTLPSGKIRAITQPLVTAKGQVKLGHLLSLKQQ
jgi:prophage antirepressor-like protein